MYVSIDTDLTLLPQNINSFVFEYEHSEESYIPNADFLQCVWVSRKFRALKYSK